MEIIKHPTPPEQAALAYCADTHAHRLHYANLIELLRRKSAEVLYAADDGLLLRDRISTAYSMSAQNLDAAERMLALVEEGCELFTGRELFYQELVREKTGLTGGEICTQVVYDTETRGCDPHPLPPHDGEVRLLEQEHAAYVHAHYHGGAERIEYIHDRIEFGMLGIFVEGKLAGFTGYHAEGSLGLLEILPEYRRHGYASVLEVALLNHALSIGQRYPYGQVVRGNAASMELQKKMGLWMDDTELFWAF